MENLSRIFPCFEGGAEDGKRKGVREGCMYRTLWGCHLLSGRIDEGGRGKRILCMYVQIDRNFQME